MQQMTRKIKLNWETTPKGYSYGYNLSDRPRRFRQEPVYVTTPYVPLNTVSEGIEPSYVDGAYVPLKRNV